MDEARFHGEGRTRTAARLPPLQRAHDNAADIVVCLECGQSFDRRDLGRVLYHAEPGHDPFLVEN